jgi:hypothetical protein
VTHVAGHDGHLSAGQYVVEVALWKHRQCVMEAITPRLRAAALEEMQEGLTI